MRNATSSLSIALAYLQLGNTGKAELNLQKALDENPTSGSVYLGYALYYQQLGDYEKAEAAFFQAKQYSPASLIPEDFVTYLCRKGEYDAATSHYTSVVSVAGDRVKKSLLIDLAECYYRQEHVEKAEEAYLQSLKQSGGSNDKALLRLAELALKRGESLVALDYLARFNASKVHVTAESLQLEIDTYQVLGMEDKVSQASQMLSALFPNHLSNGHMVTEGETSESLPKPQTIDDSQVIATSIADTSIEETETPASEESARHHILKKGETLYRVTRMYDVSLEQLRAWNPELEINNISIGTKIYLQDQ